MGAIENDKKSAKRLQSRKRCAIMVIIGECSAYLRELSGKDAEPTPEQKQRILQEIKENHQD